MKQIWTSFFGKLCLSVGVLSVLTLVSCNKSEDATASDEPNYDEIEALVNSPEFFNYYSEALNQLFTFNRAFEGLTQENQDVVRELIEEVGMSDPSEANGIAEAICSLMKFDIRNAIEIENEYAELKNKLQALPQMEVEEAIAKRHSTIIEDIKTDVKTRQRGWWWINDISWCEAKCGVWAVGGAISGSIGNVPGAIIAIGGFTDCVYECNKK